MSATHSVPFSPEETAPPAEWKLLLSPSEMEHVIDRLALKLDAHFASEPKEIVFVAILSGAVYFVVDLSRRLKHSHSLCFVSCSSYHNSQTQSEEVKIDPVNCNSKKFENKVVILIDELYDNGLTLASVKRHLIDSFQVDPANLYSCVALRKRKPVTAHDPPTFCGIDLLPDLWYVGYGLDDCGTKRGWRGLWAIPKIPGVPQTEDDEIFSADTAAAAAKFQSIHVAIQSALKQ